MPPMAVAKQAPDGKLVGDKAKDDWQSSDAAAAYRQSRQPTQYKRYDREEAIVSEWLRNVKPGGLVADVPCGTGRFVQTITRLGLR